MSEKQQEQQNVQEQTVQVEQREQVGRTEQGDDWGEKSLESRMGEQQEQIEELKAELARMRTLPHLVDSTPGGETAADRQQFAAMGYSQRVQLRRENPALYAALTN